MWDLRKQFLRIAPERKHPPLFYAQPLGLDPRSGAILRFKPLKSSPEMKP
jgi:hypothetical protein